MFAECGRTVWAHVIKEVREQLRVLVTVPLVCALAAILARVVVDQRSLELLPVVLAGAAGGSVAIVLALDLFAAELRRGSAVFLARIPGARTSSMLVKTGLLLAAVSWNGMFGWLCGAAAAGEHAWDLSGSSNKAEWMWPIAGLILWTATTSCVMQRPGRALILALLPWLLFAAWAYFGLGQLPAAPRFYVDRWWWPVWGLVVAPVGLAATYGLRVRVEAARAHLVSWSLVFVMPSVTLGGVLLSLQSAYTCPGSTCLDVHVAENRRSAFVSVSATPEHAHLQYALLVDLESGDARQVGGVGGYWVVDSAWYGRAEAVGYAHDFESGQSRDGHLQPVPRRESSAEPVTFVAAVSRHWPGIGAAESLRRYADSIEGGFRLRADSLQPFGLWVLPSAGDPVLWSALSQTSVPSERLDPPGVQSSYSDRVFLVAGGEVRSRRSREASGTVRRRWFIDRETGEHRSLGGLADGERILGVLDQNHVIIGREGRGGEVVGWLDVESGLRGEFSWGPVDRPRSIGSLYRGRDVRDLLLHTHAANGAGPRELVWDDASRIRRVVVSASTCVTYWDGGDDVIVTVSNRIERIRCDGQRTVLFEIGSP